MQFQVPQFIEVEDKIFGPLTFRQFMYLAGGAGLCFILYVYIPSIILSIIPIAIIAGLAAALAFYKYNGRSFIYTLEALFKYLYTKKLYIWRKENPTPKKAEIIDPTAQTAEGLMVPKLSEGRLKELAWSLDIKNNSNDQNG